MLRRVHRFFAKFSLARQLVAIGIVATLLGASGGLIGAAGVFSIAKDFRSYENLAGDTLLATEINADMAKAILFAQRHLATGEDAEMKEARRFLAEARQDIKDARAAFMNPAHLRMVEDISAAVEEFEMNFDRMVWLRDESQRLSLDELDRLGPEARSVLTGMMAAEWAKNDFQIAAAIGLVQENFLTARLYAHKFLITKDTKAAERVEAEFRELEPGIERLLKLLNETPMRLGKVAEVKQVTAKIALYLEEFRLLRKYAEELQLLTAHTFVDDGNLITGLAAELKNFKIADENQLAKAALGKAATSESLVLAATILAVILSLLIFLIFSRILTEALRALTGEMSALATGDTAVEITGLSRRDEIGEMAKALSVFKNTILEKRRIETAAAEQKKIEAERASTTQEQAEVVRVIGEGLRGLVQDQFMKRIAVDVPEKYEKLKQDFNSTVEQLEGYVSEQQRSKSVLEHMVLHDNLTGLPNRIMLQRRLDRLLAKPVETRNCAVMCIDLDGFKVVNDTFGHAVADSVLIEVAARLRHLAREKDLVVRMGGDEFGIVQDGVVDIQKLAENVLAAVAQPFEINGHSVGVGCSIGIARAPEDGNDATALLQHADIALYRSKRDGCGNLRFFDYPMFIESQARRGLEQNLRKALGNGELELHYQPMLDVAKNTVVGFEALMRWHHPQRGEIKPINFIAAAEDAGLIVKMGEWALGLACATARTWPDHLIVAVNISVLQLTRGDLAETVSSALQATGLAPHRLELEITESVFANDLGKIPKMLQKIRDLGVRISLDDFGTGYSSLSYLRKFPIDKLKIDQSFIAALSDGGPDALAVMQSICGIGRALHLDVTAEGVETAAQMDMIRAEGCDVAQGYLLGKPMSATDIERAFFPKIGTAKTT